MVPFYGWGSTASRLQSHYQSIKISLSTFHLGIVGKREQLRDKEKADHTEVPLLFSIMLAIIFRYQRLRRKI